MVRDRNKDQEDVIRILSRRVCHEGVVGGGGGVAFLRALCAASSGWSTPLRLLPPLDDWRLTGNGAKVYLYKLGLYGLGLYSLGLYSLVLYSFGLYGLDV